MLEPGVSEIGAVVGSYSEAHRVDNSVELPHVSCIPERAKLPIKYVTKFGSRSP